MDLYSRIVQFLKVALPLTALALLSTLFLLSRGNDIDAVIPFAQQDMADRIRDQQITKPYYSGTTEKGEEILVTADYARPGSPGKPAEAIELRATIFLNSGRVIKLDSELGSIAPDRGQATFTGDVVIQSSDGMTITTDLLTTELDVVAGESPGEIHGTGPIGEFTAGAMQFGSEKSDGPVHMHFTDGVKLIYDPQKAER
ncbi:MAG: LPS export ABC transporter periplasmic protein LptC [Pseudomonadota bacterium]